MTDLIYDYITQGVDMILSAAILSSIIILLRGAAILGNVSADQTATSTKIGYYREYAKYDCKDGLLSSDALGAIVYYRDTVQVIFYPKDNREYKIYNDPARDGKFFVKDGSNPEVEISYNTLKEYCGNYAGKSYQGMLFEDASTTASDAGYKGGLVTGIEIY